MTKGLALAVLATLAVAVGGCTNNPQTNKELQCAGGVLGGAALGGLIGNQIGGGSGKQLATAAGAGLGAAAGTQTQACQ
jgi:outer membrane lipoprotein SlyB